MSPPAAQGRLSRSRSPRQTWGARLFARRGGGKKESDRKDVHMNQPIQAEELITETHLETDASEREQLVQCGCSTEEIVALLWRRRWYQTGGSDRMELVRHWEFLKWLIRASMLEE
jgi:hypothetical protein